MSERKKKVSERKKKVMAVDSRVSPIRLKARELLQDGEWHDYEKIAGKLMKLIPPGVAYRKAEESRRWTQFNRYGAVKERDAARDPGVDRVARSGARQIVWDIVAHAVEFEVEPGGRNTADGGVRRRIRLVKDRLPYNGWRAPEDMTARTREVLGFWMQGLGSLEIMEKLGNKNSNAGYYVLEMARENIEGLDTIKPSVVIPALIEKGLLPPLPPLDDLEKRILEDYRQFSTNQLGLQVARLKVDKVEFERARRRLGLRYGKATNDELWQAVRAGEITD